MLSIGTIAEFWRLAEGDATTDRHSHPGYYARGIDPIHGRFKQVGDGEAKFWVVSCCGLVL
jgi:hypothetical protein